jgi:hypothetical protein
MTWIVESDRWGAGPNILAEATLASIRAVLEQSPVIVEHRFYRGSRAPARMVFEDYDNFLAHLREQSRPGDAVYVWRYDELCRDTNIFARGKTPDERGRVPEGGPY